VSEANVTNIEALERFRSSLVLFLERAGFVLDEVSEEVKRTRIWLQTEQSMKLGHEMKRRQRELEQLEQEMFTARLSDLAQKKTGMQMQINKKRREIRELEEKIRSVKAWLRNFDSVVETEARKAEKLRQQIDIDMARAVTFLTESVKQLRAYSDDT
jgi:chromosome segregation ATPase